jgi:hypothetical protein
MVATPQKTRFQAEGYQALSFRFYVSTRRRRGRSYGIAKCDTIKIQNNIWAVRYRNSHDRFLIIDDKAVSHLGATLKDLGKKWFSFLMMDKEAFNPK